MKIIGFEDFAASPVGTIFSYYEPAICNGLYRKGETLRDGGGDTIDFFESTIMAACWNGEHPVVDDIQCRWGMYDFSQQFAVYEPKDIEAMVAMLTGK